MRHFFCAAAVSAAAALATPAVAQSGPTEGLVDTLVNTMCAAIPCENYTVAVDAAGMREIRFTPVIPAPSPEVTFGLDEVVIAHSTEPMSFSDALPRFMSVSLRGLQVGLPPIDPATMPEDQRAIVQLGVQFLDVLIGEGSELTVTMEETTEGLLAFNIKMIFASGDAMTIAAAVRMEPGMPMPPLDTSAFAGAPPELAAAGAEFQRVGVIFVLMPIDSISLDFTEDKIYDLVIEFLLTFVAQDQIDLVLSTVVNELENYPVNERPVQGRQRTYTVSQTALETSRDMHLFSWRSMLDWRSAGSRTAMVMRPNQNVSFLTVGPQALNLFLDLDFINAGMQNAAVLEGGLVDESGQVNTAAVTEFVLAPVELYAVLIQELDLSIEYTVQ